MALDSAIALAGAPGRSDVLGVQRLFGSIAVVDLDAPPEIVAPHVSGLRVFAGNCGWSPGQLDTEIDDDFWVVVDAEIGDLFDPKPQTLWARVLERQAAPLRYLASFPDDPSLN